MATPWEITLHLLLPALQFQRNHWWLFTSHLWQQDPWWSRATAVTCDKCCDKDLYSRDSNYSPDPRARGRKAKGTTRFPSVALQPDLSSDLSWQQCWAAAHKILPGGILVKKIWSCRSKSLFSKSQLWDHFPCGSSLLPPIGSTTHPERSCQNSPLRLCLLQSIPLSLHHLHQCCKVLYWCPGFTA